MGRRQRNRVKTKKGMWIVVALMIVVCATMLFQASRLEKSSRALAVQQTQIEQKISDATQKSKELDQKRAYMQTDEYVEEVAREKLGMVKDDEILFKTEDKK